MDYERRFGTSPEETLYKLLSHADPDIRLRAAGQLINKKVPTPRQIDLGDLSGTKIRGQIVIDIGAGNAPHVIGQQPDDVIVQQDENSDRSAPMRPMISREKMRSVNLSSKFTKGGSLLPMPRKPL